jgi:quinol monooxygenase YgiN
MKHAFEDKLVMIAELVVKPELRDQFFAYTLENLAICRAAAGNIEFDILIDDANPEHVLFYEVWQSAEAQQAYMGWRVQRGDLTMLLSYLAAEPKFTALRSVGA